MPRIRHSWRELPKWAADGLPFDARHYFEIPDSENREPIYLSAYLAFDFRASEILEGIELPPGYQGLREASEVRLKKVRAFYERCTDGYRRRPRVTSQDLAEATEIVEEFANGLQRLEQAQLRPRCFFHIDIDVSALFVDEPRGIYPVLFIRTQVDLGSGLESRNARIALRLMRDLRWLREPLIQSVLARNEWWILNDTVWTVLESPTLADDTLREMVVVLQEHYLAQQDFDPCVEAARYEYLMWRDLLRQLENGEYASSVQERSEKLGLAAPLPAPALLVKELTDLGGYQVHAAALDEYIRERAKQDPTMQRAAERLDQARSDDEKLDPVERWMQGDRVESAGVALIVAQVMASMTADDFAREVALLDARYKAIEAAARLPYPQSTTELKVLCKHWTCDDAWRTTRLLRWFEPNQFQYKSRMEGALQRNAVFCVAATLLWIREHDGRLPNSLNEVFSAIGLDHIPVDPYSGDPLQMTSIDGRTVIYSVGPDGDDDRAARPIDVFHGGPALIAKIPPDGDVVFQLGLEPGSGVLE